MALLSRQGIGADYASYVIHQGMSRQIVLHVILVTVVELTHVLPRETMRVR